MAEGAGREGTMDAGRIVELVDEMNDTFSSMLQAMLHSDLAVASQVQSGASGTRRARRGLGAAAVWLVCDVWLA